ncbi:hypothetical protein E2H86_11610 [Pseudomonas putida]|uniref:hypothetical protein n=1 Tax=Pseudomonas putida TaxID=303 RepID=UPI001059CA39|nr:hypothetical protein [Pseudomonas putida]TDJ76419.1 hypothetical protein E2H86_11610 [Pseudomonas putida]
MGLPSWEELKNREGWRMKKRTSAWRALGIALISTVISFVATSLITYGYLSFYDPAKLVLLTSNKSAVLALGLGGGIIFIVFGVWISFLGKSDFAGSNLKMTKELARDFYFQKSNAASADGENKIYDRSVSEAIDKIMHPFDYEAGSQDTLFERYITGILKSLSSYASRSEETAAKLLEKGVAFMAGGLLFYVVAIVAWQFYAKLASPVEHLLYIGMIACSTTFLVIEFLAAWFFKQYRYYVDVSMSCLRVRSVYDRYLLSFYALKEFDSGGVGARDKMLEILHEDVKWPSYQATTRNDFNHMLETVAVLSNSLDKVKDIFKRKSNESGG